MPLFLHEAEPRGMTLPRSNEGEKTRQSMFIFNILLFLEGHRLHRSICRTFNTRDTYWSNVSPDLELLEYARVFVVPESHEPPSFLYRKKKMLKSLVSSPMLEIVAVWRVAVLFKIFGITESQKKCNSLFCAFTYVENDVLYICI